MGDKSAQAITSHLPPAVCLLYAKNASKKTQIWTGFFYIRFITSNSAVAPPVAPFSLKWECTVCRDAVAFQLQGNWYFFSLLCYIKTAPWWSRSCWSAWWAANCCVTNICALTGLRSSHQHLLWTCCPPMERKSIAQEEVTKAIHKREDMDLTKSKCPGRGVLIQDTDTTFVLILAKYKWETGCPSRNTFSFKLLSLTNASPVISQKQKKKKTPDCILNLTLD